MLKLRFHKPDMRMRHKNGKCPYIRIRMQIRQSGSLNGPIGVNEAANAAPFAIEQPATLTFRYKSVASKTENRTGIHAAWCICMSRIRNPSLAL